MISNITLKFHEKCFTQSSCLGSPSAPSGPLVITEVLKNSMTLSWQPPYTDGGSPITSYIIEKQDTDSLLGWSRVDRVKAHIYSYTVTHLLEGHRYNFRVIAESSFGRSIPLQSRASIEAKSPFGKNASNINVGPYQRKIIYLFNFE